MGGSFCHRGTATAGSTLHRRSGVSEKMVFVYILPDDYTNTACKNQAPPPRCHRPLAICQPPPSDWISATAVVWRSACDCTSARRAASAVFCAVTTSL